MNKFITNQASDDSQEWGDKDVHHGEWICTSSIAYWQVSRTTHKWYSDGDLEFDRVGVGLPCIMSTWRSRTPKQAQHCEFANFAWLVATDFGARIQTEDCNQSSIQTHFHGTFGQGLGSLGVLRLVNLPQACHMNIKWNSEKHFRWQQTLVSND